MTSRRIQANARLILKELEKQGFVPMPGGQPPMDPMAAMGGGMPMDPMAAMGGGGMPMDPMAAAGGMPPMDPMAAMGGMPMDPMAAAAPAGGPGSNIDPAIKQYIDEQISSGGGKKKGKGGTAERLDRLEQTINAIAQAMGVPPAQPAPEEGENQAAEVFGDPDNPTEPSLSNAVSALKGATPIPYGA